MVLMSNFSLESFYLINSAFKPCKLPNVFIYRQLQNNPNMMLQFCVLFMKYHSDTLFMSLQWCESENPLFQLRFSFTWVAVSGDQGTIFLVFLLWSLLVWEGYVPLVKLSQQFFSFDPLKFLFCGPEKYVVSILQLVFPCLTAQRLLPWLVSHGAIQHATGNPRCWSDAPHSTGLD